MKKLICLAIISFCLFSLSLIPIQANSAARGWCEYGNQTVTTGGLTSSTKVQKSFPSCTVTVYDAGTSNVATIFADNAGSPTPLANPFTAQANGSWQFFANQGLYDVVLSGGSLPVPLTFSGISMFDPTAITTVTATGLIVNGSAIITGNMTASTVAGNTITSAIYEVTATLFAALGTPANGTIKYCSNCTIASPCASGGTGALAKRLNGGWVCN